MNARYGPIPSAEAQASGALDEASRANASVRRLGLFLSDFVMDAGPLLPK